MPFPKLRMKHVRNINPDSLFFFYIIHSNNRELRAQYVGAEHNECCPIEFHSAESFDSNVSEKDNDEDRLCNKRRGLKNVNSFELS